MKRAKGPSSLHSPFSAPGLDSPPEDKLNGEVGVMVEIEAECLRVAAARYDRVGGRTSPTISAGSEWVAEVGRPTSSGDMFLEKKQAGRARGGKRKMRSSIEKYRS